MKLQNLNVDFNKVLGIKNNKPKNYKVNFRGCDVVDFSYAAKEKAGIKHDLEEIGLSSEDANEMIKKYYGTEEYKNLTTLEDNISNHWVNIDKSLTPSEAIAY